MSRPTHLVVGLTVCLGMTLGCGSEEAALRDVAAADATSPDAASPDAASPDAGSPDARTPDPVDCAEVACGAWHSAYDADGQPRPACNPNACAAGSVCRRPDIPLTLSADGGACHPYVLGDPAGICVPRALFQQACAIPTVCVPQASPCLGAEEQCTNRMCPQVDCARTAEQRCRVALGGRFKQAEDPIDCLEAAFAAAAPRTKVVLIAGLGDSEFTLTVTFVGAGLAMVDQSDIHGTMGHSGQYGPVRPEPDALAACLADMRAAGVPNDDEGEDYLACVRAALTVCPADLGLPTVTEGVQAARSPDSTP